MYEGLLSCFIYYSPELCWQCLDVLHFWLYSCTDLYYINRLLYVDIRVADCGMWTVVNVPGYFMVSDRIGGSTRTMSIHWLSFHSPVKLVQVHTINTFASHWL